MLSYVAYVPQLVCVYFIRVCVCKPLGHMGLWSTLDLIWSDLISSQLADVEQ